MSNGSGPVNNYAVTSNNCGPSAISDIIREPSVLSFKVAVNGEQSPWLYGHRKFERIANFVSRHVCSERPTEFTIYWKTALISRINNVRFTVSNRHRLTSVDCLAAAIVDAVGDDCDVLLNDNGVLVVTDDRRVRHLPAVSSKNPRDYPELVIIFQLWFMLN